MVLPCDDEWEIHRENIKLLEVIGEGAFGKVLKAEAFDITRLKTNKSIVAVKTLKGSCVTMIYKRNNHNLWTRFMSDYQTGISRNR